MNKRIFICRCGPYDDTSLGRDVYESFEKMARGGDKICLSSKASAIFTYKFPREFCGCSLVMSAPERRCIQTAQMVGGKEIRILSELGEIGFSMPEIISRKDFFSGGKPQVDRARMMFVEKLIKGEIQEPLENIFLRIKRVLKILDGEKFEKAVLVSHSFLMKVMETFIRDLRIERQPELMKTYFSGKDKLYDYFGGFTISMYNSGKERKIEI
jgi:hypothetical protein